MAHILVTGGAGFIGSHLVERLLAQGERVSIVDDFNEFYDPSIKRRNVETAVAHAACRLYEGDIRDTSLLDSVWTREPIDVVVHLAAWAGVRPSIKDLALYADVNVVGTVKMLDAARKYGCGKFIFASSSRFPRASRIAPKATRKSPAASALTRIARTFTWRPRTWSSKSSPWATSSASCALVRAAGKWSC